MEETRLSTGMNAEMSGGGGSVMTTELSPTSESSNAGNEIWNNGGWHPGLVIQDLHQWLSFEDRVTYTYANEHEVGSLHFDSGRGEIFFKGHNARNMELENWHWELLEKMSQVLQSNRKLRAYSPFYERAFQKMKHERNLLS